MAFTDSGSSETTKAAVHGSLFTLAALCGVYNAAAYVQRREPHLARNAIVYGALMIFEVINVRHHCAGRRESLEIPSA